MKKVFIVYLALFFVLTPVLAMAQPTPPPPATDTGWIQCGKGSPTKPCDPPATGTCSNEGDGPGQFKRCELKDIFALFQKAFNFLVWQIALPLTGLFIVIGGILMAISMGNPGLAGTAKNMLKFSMIGLGLVLGSWLIIDFVLKAIGYTANWSKF